MMHMTFYWSKEVTLLFATWRTATCLSYALSLLACLLLSSFYQYLENFRLRFKSSSAETAAASSADQTLLRPKGFCGGKLSALKVAGAVLFGINSAIGYFLMLAVMSFNGGVFVAVVLGLTIGFFLFRSEEEGLISVDNPCACA